MQIAGRVLQSWLVDWPQQRSVWRLQSAVRTQPEWQRKGTTGAFFYVCVCLRRGFSSAEQRLELLEAECTNWAGSRIRVRRWVVRSQECLNMLLIRICDKWSHSGGAQSQRFLFCFCFLLNGRPWQVRCLWQYECMQALHCAVIPRLLDKVNFPKLLSRCYRRHSQAVCLQDC